MRCVKRCDRVLGMMALALLLPTAARASSIASVPTFTRDIAPILFEHCAACHHAGEVAPFSLLTYADARKHSSEIAELTASRQMPPWKPEHGFGEFVGERRLSDEQIATIAAWVKAGRPEGEAADLAPAPKFAEGWVLGEPDLVVTVPKPFNVPAEGRDIIRSFVVPLNLAEDKYVEAVEFRPSNRKVVHHAILELDASGQARQLDGADGQPGFGRGAGGPGFIPSGGLGGWAPGVTPRRLPEGVARVLRKGSDLVIQTHFHPSGKAALEQSTVGLYFARRSPEKLFVSFMKAAQPRKLDIAPGDKNFELTQDFVVPSDLTLQAVFPHAHLVCKEIQVSATLPDGKDLPIIWIRNWDWDWQDEYQFAHPLHVPKGTHVHMRFRFDNSSENLKNPSNPPRRVHWGEQTSDEMAIVFFQLVMDRQAAAAFRDQRLARLRQLIGGITGAAGTK